MNNISAKCKSPAFQRTKITGLLSNFQLDYSHIRFRCSHHMCVLPNMIQLHTNYEMSKPFFFFITFFDMFIHSVIEISSESTI